MKPLKPELFIARRYLASTRNSFSVALLKWIGTIGIAIGVFSLIVVISIMRGFERDFEQKIRGFQAQLTIELAPTKGDTDDAALPTVEELVKRRVGISDGEMRIEGEVVIETSFGSSSAARVRGVDKAPEDIHGLGRLYFPDEFKNSFSGTDEDLPGIILGGELAVNLQVHPDFRDEVRLVFPFGEISPTGEILPRVRRFRVAGIFDSGFYEYDSKFAVIAGAQASRLFGEYARNSLALYVTDQDDSDAIKRVLQKDDSSRGWKITTWRERNVRLFQALVLERLGMFLLLSMIVLLASFTVFALLSMIVLEKVKDMAVLRAVGFMKSQVRRVFLWQALRIGLRGTFMGCFLGIVACLWLVFFPIKLPASYYIEYLPISFEPWIILIVILVGPLVSGIAGLYPSRQSVRPVIAEVLRYE